jgi:adenosylhomocysteine nucleosidase
VARVGFITGLVSEADCLAPLVDGSRLRVAGLGPAAAERCAQDLIDDGCDLLVSFGLAGGLVSGVAPGRIIVADAVIAPDGHSFAPDKNLCDALLRGCPVALSARLAGSDTILAGKTDKIALQQRTGASAVDMESHHIARCADKAGAAFLVIRAIADPRTARIPEAAAGAVDSQGRPQVGRVLSRLALRPWDIFALLKLAIYARTAHASLRRVAPIVVGCIGGR